MCSMLLNCGLQWIREEMGETGKYDSIVQNGIWKMKEEDLFNLLQISLTDR